jgi:hypothetical protein
MAVEGADRPPFVGSLGWATTPGSQASLVREAKDAFYQRQGHLTFEG